MTRDADLKAMVRARMGRTGENYTTAREAVLREPSPARPAGGTVANPVVDKAADTMGDPGAEQVGDPAADKAVRSFFDGDRLRSIPTKRRARAAVLMHLLGRFERGRDYPEVEVNEVLRTAHADISTLRRELVDYRWLRRGEGIYRVADEVPERSANERQEVPADEAARLAGVPVHRC